MKFGGTTLIMLAFLSVRACFLDWQFTPPWKVPGFN